MEISDCKIKSVIDERERKDVELFFVDLCTVGNNYGIDLVKRKKYFGLADHGEVIISPIFDEIIWLSANAVALKIEDKYSIFRIDTKLFVSQFDFLSLIQEGTYWKLFSGTEYVSLYDIEKENLLFGESCYSEYGLIPKNTQYFWAKRGKFFDYFHRNSGRIISLPGVVMAYDTLYGMFGKDEYDKISYFEESGIENALKLRQIVYEAGGYLVLNNFTYKIEHVIDVYGNILNI